MIVGLLSDFNDPRVLPKFPINIFSVLGESGILDYISYIKNSSPSLADGEYRKDKNIRAVIQTITTKPRGQKKAFEAHKRCIDIHVCFEGSEFIAYAPEATLKVIKEYNSDKDYALYEIPERATMIYMIPETFAIFFPADGHMPGITVGNVLITRKAVFKVDVDFLALHDAI